MISPIHFGALVISGFSQQKAAQQGSGYPFDVSDPDSFVASFRTSNSPNSEAKEQPYVYQLRQDTFRPRVRRSDEWEWNTRTQIQRGVSDPGKLLLFTEFEQDIRPKSFSDFGTKLGAFETALAEKCREAGLDVEQFEYPKRDT